MDGRRKMNKIISVPSLAESKRTDEAYVRTQQDTHWLSCGQSHWDALPDTVRDSIEKDYKARIVESSAVVLEVLPPLKRGRIERALNHHRLESQNIVGTRYTLVTEKSLIQGLFSLSPSPKLLDILRG